MSLLARAPVKADPVGSPHGQRENSRTYAGLQRGEEPPLESEERCGAVRQAFARALLTGAGVATPDPDRIVQSLEWLSDALTAEARKQGAMPKTYGSAVEYDPPSPG